MIGLIFLAAAIAMMTALAGYRGASIGLFGVSAAVAVLWLDRYMTEPLKLSF